MNVALTLDSELDADGNIDIDGPLTDQDCQKIADAFRSYLTPTVYFWYPAQIKSLHEQYDIVLRNTRFVLVYGLLVVKPPPQIDYGHAVVAEWNGNRDPDPEKNLTVQDYQEVVWGNCLGKAMNLGLWSRLAQSAEETSGDRPRLLSGLVLLLRSGYGFRPQTGRDC